jgi:c(7)-type cytochrome triheme protein
MKEAVPPCRRPEPGSRGMPTANLVGLTALWLLVVAGGALVLLTRSTDARSPEPVTPATVAAPVVDVTLPESYTFPRHRMSPARVTFSHRKHIGDQMTGSCRSCHQDLFSLRKPGKPLRGTLDHAAMDRGELCGRCHNGRDAFSTTDSCQRCHR